MSALQLEFASRGLEGLVSVRMVPNENPRATGHDLVAANFDEETFQGFPLVTAQVLYPGEGPRAIFYWLQTVTQELVEGSTFCEVDTIVPPYYSFGYRPEFMDAPANPEHPDMDWVARTFLTEAPRVIVSSTLRPLTGFVWGYQLRSGRVSRLFGPSEASGEDWSSVRSQYSQEFPDLELTEIPDVLL